MTFYEFDGSSHFEMVPIGFWEAVSEWTSPVTRRVAEEDNPTYFDASEASETLREHVKAYRPEAVEPPDGFTAPLGMSAREHRRQVHALCEAFDIPLTGPVREPAILKEKPTESDLDMLHVVFVRGPWKSWEALAQDAGMSEGELKKRVTRLVSQINTESFRYKSKAVRDAELVESALRVRPRSGSTEWDAEQALWSRHDNS
jgi:hypothetical protein